MTVFNKSAQIQKPGADLFERAAQMTESEKERFGKSAMIRYVSGIDQPIYPIAYIKNKIPMAKKAAVAVTR